ncbi:thioredoxin family protein [Thalassolituus oleivorans]|uniref:Redox-active disulfide protein 2 n=2 Tax=root TaxID=1 RepID=M5DQ42_9GAMM|nr:thioredoxin family protein [Thalassolituus oleivorans]MCA6129433.1 glutaredoxin [Thalassolituus oleivorans 4BN06-13]CCU71613.1 redox-active disulfide protein 2 [Thalassolituus oleivorans MIL-1]
MKQIKVLGSGCAKCVKTAAVIQAIAEEHGVPVNLVKETSAEVMMNYGVMSTPAVVVDEVVVHSGSIPDRKKVESWL